MRSTRCWSARPTPPRSGSTRSRRCLARRLLRAVGSSLGRRDLWRATISRRNYAGRARDLRSGPADAQINRDRDLRLQYLAGRRESSRWRRDLSATSCAIAGSPTICSSASTALWGKLQEAIEGSRNECTEDRRVAIVADRRLCGAGELQRRSHRGSACSRGHDAHFVRAGLAMGSELKLTAWTADEAGAAAVRRGVRAVRSARQLMSVWRQGSDILRVE